jgi:hypothetical protein
VFHIKTASDTATVAKATMYGLSQNTNSVQSAMPLQLGKVVPAEPGRFKLDDISAAFTGQGGALMKIAMAQNGGVGMKSANCEGAVWTAKAVRTISGSNSLTLYSCIYKYKAGYNLDMYAVFQKQEGGLYQVIREGANAIVGTPEQWVNKTIMDTVHAIENATSAKVVHVEGQPELSDLPAIGKFSKN